MLLRKKLLIFDEGMTVYNNLITKTPPLNLS